MKKWIDFIAARLGGNETGSELPKAQATTHAHRHGTPYRSRLRRVYDWGTRRLLLRAPRLGDTSTTRFQYSFPNR